MYRMTDAEFKFAELIWEGEPMGSGELVKRCGDRFGWKKSTTYTFLKKLCGQGIFRNEKATVSSVVKREEYLQRQGEEFVDKAFGGSLPSMVAAFIRGRRLTEKQAEEIEEMIRNYREGE